MKTEVAIDGEEFLINGRPTWEGRSWQSHSIEGLLFNSRMVQAIVDDENPETRELWRYPDSGCWDPERNTSELCAELPVYRRHGLHAITVGLQGGGSIYRPEVWNECILSGFRADGSLKKDWTDRLLRVLTAADDSGMVVIVNLFYWKQIRHIPDDAKVVRAVQSAAEWLLQTGFRNILLDIANESADWWNRSICEPDHIGDLVRAAKDVTVGGRRLLSASSTGGGNVPTEAWLEQEDFSLPHGNGNTPEVLARRLQTIRELAAFKKRPRPLLINEDGVDLANLDVAVQHHASWGYYAQGAGSDGEPYTRIWPGPRERHFEDLSGFQTLPVNWSINTPHKRAFFDRVRAITSGLTP